MTALPNALANLVKPTRYVSVTDTAKLIRRALKEAFPEIKFSVTSKSYSGGASINVAWLDGPQTEQVEAIAKAFQGGYFDGMTDYKGGHKHALDGEPVRFGGDFVFCNRHWNPGTRTNLLTVLASRSPEEKRTIAARLGVAEWYHPTDGDERLAWLVFANRPAPEYEGRRSKLAESVNLLDSY